MDRGSTRRKGKIELRGVEEQDAEFLYQWASSSEIAPHTLGRRFPMQISSIHEWIKMSNCGEFPTRIAYLILDGSPVGLAQLDQIDWIAKTAWLGVWVIPVARSAGCGSVAVKHLIKFASESFGLRQIRLLVRKDNQPAILIYHRFGFQPEGELENAEYRDGTFQNLILMRLNLQ